MANALAAGLGIAVLAVLVFAAVRPAATALPFTLAAFFCGLASAALAYRAVLTAETARADAATGALALSHAERERLTDEVWELREEVERTARIVEASGDVVLLRDERGLVTGANAAFTRLFGLEAEEVAGRPLLGLVARDAANAGARPEGTGDVGLLPLCDLSADTPQGPRWFSWTETRLDDDTGTIQCIGRDVTDRKATEAALSVARDQAEAASAAKSRFLAMVSHEIRTPLNGILGMTNLLQQTALTSEQQSYARAIETSGDALLLLIDDLLDFSKIEAGRLDLTPAPASVGDVVESLAELLAPRAHAKGIELAAYIDPRLPDRLMFDAVRLRQVLFNLAGNGIKFTAEGGVAIEVFHAGGEDEVGDGAIDVLFQVRDTGIGVEAADSDRIFREFEQADPGPARAFGGTGLGLAISRRLVQLMGGDIGLESAPGSGACFFFTIRLHRDTAGMPAAPQAEVRAQITALLPPLGAQPPGVGARAHQLRLIEALARGEIRAKAGSEAESAAGVAGAVALSRGAVAPEKPTSDMITSDVVAGPSAQPLAGRRVLLVSHALIEGPLVLRRLFERGADVVLATQQQIESHLSSADPIDVILVDGAIGDPLAAIERIRTVTGAPAGILVDPLQRGALPAWLEAGYGAWLVKPVRSSSLLLTVRTLLGEADFSPRPDALTRPAPAPAARPLDVLLCDDNEINLLLGRGLLEKLGHRVTAAADGRRALALVEERAAAGGRFDLVLMDLHMPEMDGFEATRRIRAMAGAAAGVPIIALTADVMPETRARCEEATFDGLLTKPLQPSGLSDLIASLFGQAEERG